MAVRWIRPGRRYLTGMIQGHLAPVRGTDGIRASGGRDLKDAVVVTANCVAARGSSQCMIPEIRTGPGRIRATAGLAMMLAPRNSRRIF